MPENEPGNQFSQFFTGEQSESSLQNFDVFGSLIQVPECNHGRFEGEQNFPDGQSESFLHFLGVFGSIMRKSFPKMRTYYDFIYKNQIVTKKNIYDINSLPGVGTGHTWQRPGIPGHLYTQICPGMQSESLLHNLFLGPTVQRKSCLVFANYDILSKSTFFGVKRIET